MDRVEIKPEITGPMNPAAEPVAGTPAVETSPETPARPDWLPEGMDSPEQLVAEYKALKEKPSAEAEPTDAGAQPTADEAAAQEKLQKFSQEFFTKGELTAESYSELAKMGYPRAVVDQFIAGQKAVVQAEEQKVYTELGGRDAYGKMIEWAAQNLSQDEIAAYNAAVESGNMTQIMFAAKGLQARYQSTGKVEPKLMGGTGKTAPAAFQSVAQVVSAMSDPRYKSDPAYRAEVERKIANSNVL